MRYFIIVKPTGPVSKVTYGTRITELKREFSELMFELPPGTDRKQFNKDLKQFVEAELQGLAEHSEGDVRYYPDKTRLGPVSDRLKEWIEQWLIHHDAQYEPQ